MATLTEQKTGSFSRATYAKDVLGRLGVPTSDTNVLTLTIWNLFEGGHYSNTAKYNLFNTTLAKPGATAINSVGVKAYPSYEVGVQATVDTLLESRYAGVRQLLAASAPPAQTLTAIGDAGWIGRNADGSMKHYPTPTALTIKQAQGLANLSTSTTDLGAATPVDLPGEGLVKNAIGGLGIGDLVGALLSGKTWVRVIEVIAGLVAAVLGMVLIAKDLTGANVGTIAKAAL